MLQIDGNNISLTRGDSAHLTVSIINGATGEEYEMQPNDTLLLTIRESAVALGQALVQKVLTGSKDFYFTPDDTKELRIRTYKYDVELRTGSDIYTIIQCSDFELLPEVTTL